MATPVLLRLRVHIPCFEDDESDELHLGPEQLKRHGDPSIRELAEATRRYWSSFYRVNESNPLLWSEIVRIFLIVEE